MEETENKKQVNFNQSKNLIRAAYLMVTSVSLLAWNNYYQGSLSGFSIPSILVLLAFGYMWIHYLSGYLKANYEPELNTRLSLKISQVFVLAAIVAHPVLISANLKSKGYGWPPDSYEFYFGSSKKLFILLGGISLGAFLLFEFKNYLKRYPKVWDYVLKLNDLAMLLVVIHGFKLGLTINSTWFKYVWLFYGVTLLYFFYDHYINKKKLKKYSEVFIVGLVVFFMLFVTLATDANTSKNPRQDQVKSSSSNSSLNSSNSSKTVSLSELASANGLNGNKCYVAVDGTVYDASDNPEWINGQHIPSRGQAKCGEDLSQVIKLSPHGDVVLNQLTEVGKLASS